MDFRFWVALCTWVGPGEGCIMEGVCDSLTFLPLTYSKEGLVSFTLSHFNSLFPWFACFAIFINSSGVF